MNKLHPITDVSEAINMTVHQELHLIEEKVSFSKSMIWDLQRTYFNKRGVDAWTKDMLPDHITTNPATAGSYAEIVFGFFRDMAGCASTINIIEIGGGPGRFAFHFLKILERIEKDFEFPDYRYILTDLSEKNLKFWKNSPSFAPFIDQGRLDFALFDIAKPAPLKLKFSGNTITHGSLDAPVLVIANYVLDTVEQDIFLIEDGEVYETLVNLYGPTIDKDSEYDFDIMKKVMIKFEYKKADLPFYEDPNLNELLRYYQRELKKTHLLIPYSGISCIEYFRKFSKSGLILLSADKGIHHKEELIDLPAPALIRHGSCFSLPVNYHALKKHCELSGGEALCSSRNFHLDVACFLYISETERFSETKFAYNRFVNELGPDDFFSIKKSLEQFIPYMSVAEISAYMRFSRYDALSFSMFIPRLSQIIGQCTDSDKKAVLEMIERVWEMYLPVDNDGQFTISLGALLYEMNEIKRAIELFEISIKIDGQSPPALYNMAMCYRQLGDKDKAGQFFDKMRKVFI